MSPYYRTLGKILEPMTDQAFSEGIETGHFAEETHKAFCVLLYYSAVRKTEALRSLKEQFRIQGARLYFDVGKRLKHGIVTPSLDIPIEAPYMDLLVDVVEDTRPGKQVFPYCPRTGYNIVQRAFGAYPHFFRLSRITNFFNEGWSIAQVHSWTGLTLNALNYYLGIVDVKRMGDSFVK